MKKTKILVFFLISLLAFSMAAFASADTKNMNPSDLEKVVFIHYKKGFEKNFAKHDFNAKPSAEAKCYKLMGVKWPSSSLPVSYKIDPSGSDLLTSDVTKAISISADTWDAATNGETFDDVYETGNVEFGVADEVNAIAFVPYSNSGVIAVTYVWYTRGTKQIVEFDMLFNTGSNWEWGDAVSNPALMDLQNIATHELGHTVGLSDLYNRCLEETMYGYSSEGETSKRSLNPGDIAGLKAIFG
ncbi:MAG TPA: matrixin family metalloprotease [Candidatus Nanoarchaeia archaeon]|nr:matrixin family metalloprotease [Candidatus Nanoarchaeia archaeon]